MIPQSILSRAQEGRFIIEDFTPLADSLEWALGQQYWRERGSKAFTSETIPVPFVINNDGNLSRQAAELFFASLLEAEKAGALKPLTPGASAQIGEARIFVVELGIGVGLFARFFLDAFKAICAQNGKDYYRRLCYIAGDRSERMLADACRNGVFANHPGRYLLRVVDALKPREHLAQEPFLAGHWPRPLRAVFLNYVLDCLPAAHLRIADGDVRQLCVRTCLARHVNLAEFTALSAQDLARRARDLSPANRKVLQELNGVLASEYEYRAIPSPPTRLPVALPGGERGEDAAPLSTLGSATGNGVGGEGNSQALPYLDFAVRFAQDNNTSHVLHNYGALQSLQGLLELLQPGGFTLINDYGQGKIEKETGFEHQRFSQSTSVGLNFPLVKAFFARPESGGARGEVQWLEPTEDSGHIYSRLLGQPVGAETARVFAERFGKAAWEWLQEPVNQARANLQHGRVEAAVSAYHQALDRQPSNWMLMNEVAWFLSFTLRNPAAGIAMAKAGLDLNPACSAELWNTLGDAYYEAGKVAQSKTAYQKALRIHGKDVRARFNLAWVFAHQRRYRPALALLADALALDETGEYQERLVKKQTQILAQLAQRNQQRFFLLANRVSNRAEAAKPSPNGEATGKNQPPTIPISEGNR